LRTAANGQITELNTRATKAISGFVTLLDELRQLAEQADVAEVMETMLERTGYRTGLEASEDPQDATRVENLNELLTVARECSEPRSGENSEPAPDEPAPDEPAPGGSAVEPASSGEPTSSDGKIDRA